MQLRAVAQEVGDAREEIVVVHAVAEQAEREVPQERQAARVRAELRARVALEHALQAQRLELDAVREDVRDALRVRRERAEEVEVRQVADGQVLRRERPVQVVQVDAPQRAPVLREELVHLRRAARTRLERELVQVLEARELELAGAVRRAAEGVP